MVVYLFGPSSYFDVLNQDFEFSRLALNALLLPANYVFEPLSIATLLPHPLIPPAWSLSTELHFYLLLPIIVLLKKRFWILLLLVTLTIQCTSFMYSSDVFNSNNFGYRFIFGVLTIFLYGYAFARRSIQFLELLSLLSGQYLLYFYCL